MAKGKNKKSALQRAEELFEMHEIELPQLALAYLQEMSRIYGAFSKVKLTALAHYAYLEEGFRCRVPWCIPDNADAVRFEIIKRMQDFKSTR